jgi:hypothetical protein
MVGQTFSLSSQTGMSDMPAPSTRRQFCQAIDLGHRDWAMQTANAWWAVGICDSCQYLPGDVNSNGSVTGTDITYLVGYFKGYNPPPPDSCHLPENPWFYVTADYNGDCDVTGADITYGTNYFKGIGPDIRWCLDFSPSAP